MVDNDGAWYHIDEHGTRSYEQSYAWVGNYQEALCPVRLAGGGYKHIDINGAYIYPEVYRYCGDFKDGVSSVRLSSGLYRHMTREGSYLHPYAYESLGVYHKRYAIAQDLEGWMHIDKSGKPIYTQRYLRIEPFYNGMAFVVRLDGVQQVIDERGECVCVL